MYVCCIYVCMYVFSYPYIYAHAQIRDKEFAEAEEAELIAQKERAEAEQARLEWEESEKLRLEALKKEMEVI